MAENLGAPRLSEIFDDIWKGYQLLDSTDEPTNSDNVQARARSCREECEKAIKMVNDLRLFSENEDIEEVSTNEIKYLLLPGMLAYFFMKSTIQERLTVVTKAKTYYTDFLRMCSNYNVSEFELPEDETEDDSANTGTAEQTDRTRGPPDVSAATRSRQNKIEKYKEQKEREQKLKELYEAVNKSHVDDEVKRDYYLTLLKSWISTSLDEIESIKQEMEILKFMAERKGSKQKQPATAPTKNPQMSRPFIITKNDLQKKVLGLGYPSVPMYTIEEWADQQIAAGTLPGPGDASNMTKINDPEYRAAETAKQDLEKEEKLEKDDQEELKKVRDWDDWKDDHRRGWGNRQNMG